VSSKHHLALVPVINYLVGMSGPGLLASFAYDYLGRRFSKTINGATTTFLSDGDDVRLELLK
jgi:hypothetical protein